MHFSTVISPSWITEQISVGKCAHRGASARQERQTSFKIVTWTKQTWTKHHNTSPFKGTITVHANSKCSSIKNRSVQLPSRKSLKIMIGQ